MSNREVMQQALEALEDERYVSAHIVDAITALKAALEQPEQEPVGSLSVRYHRGSKSMTNFDFDYNGDLPEGDYELYTTQPAAQRPWVGLEAEDLAQIDTDEFWQTGNHMAIALAVEAKLKAKNGH